MRHLVAQLDKYLTLDFSSGHDLSVVSSSPHQEPCSVGSLLKILSLPPHPPLHPVCVHAFSPKINKFIF